MKPRFDQKHVLFFKVSSKSERIWVATTFKLTCASSQLLALYLWGASRLGLWRTIRFFRGISMSDDPSNSDKTRGNLDWSRQLLSRQLFKNRCLEIKMAAISHFLPTQRWAYANLKNHQSLFCSSIHWHFYNRPWSWDDGAGKRIFQWYSCITS